MLTFSSSGSVSDHLVLHPQLATGNFIIKAVWLPGSQTELAIVTADFVKVASPAVGAVGCSSFFPKLMWFWQLPNSLACLSKCRSGLN